MEVLESFIIDNFDTVVFMVTTLLAAIAAVIKAYQASGLSAALIEAGNYADDVMKAVNKFMSNVDSATVEERELAKTVLKKDTYCMSDEVRQFILTGLSESDKIIANNTIDDNETNGIYNYTIRLSNRWYKISLGQIAGSAVW